jgi:hypothetical protein
MAEVSAAMELNSFWYIYASNGTDGFLLDLIRRPTNAVARLAVYSQDKPPVVLRETLPLDQLHGGDGDLDVRMGSLALSPSGCHGRLGDINLELNTELNGTAVAFVPRWLHRLFGFVPLFASHYGRLEGGRCQDVAYGKLPLVYSTYQVGNIARSRWYIISAFQFDGDLAFEISASRIAGIWGTSAYIKYLGREYRLTNPVSSLFIFRTRHGGEIVDGKRIFDVSIRSPQIRMDIRASAPVSDFVLLENEGATEINTTLFGDCEAVVTLRGTNSNAPTNRFEAKRSCLLEIKDDAS